MSLPNVLPANSTVLREVLNYFETTLSRRIFADFLFVFWELSVFAKEVPWGFAAGAVTTGIFNFSPSPRKPSIDILWYNRFTKMSAWFTSFLTTSPLNPDS